MKAYRKAIIFGIVAVLAGFSYWFFEVKKKKEKEEIVRQEALLFEESDRRIVSLSLREKGEEEIRLEWQPKPEEEIPEGEELGDDEAGDWMVTAPVSTGGDNMAIDSMLKAMVGQSSEEVIREGLEKKAEYGLDDPEYSVRFSYEGDSTVHGIDLGKKTLDGQKLFAVLAGEDRIYTVPATILDVVKKSLFDVRDKKIAPFEKEDIVGIITASGMNEIYLEKEGEDWYLLPQRVRASETRVDIYTGNLRWESFVEVIEEEGTDFQRYGLDRPRIIVTFRLADDSAFLFVVGDMAGEEENPLFYATRSIDNMIFRVTGETVQKLLTTEFYLRDRSIFDFEQESVQSLTFAKKDESYTFTRSGEDDWVLDGVENVDGGGEFLGEVLERGYKIDNVIRGVATSEYEDLEPLKRGEQGYGETGIESPVYELVLRFQDDREPLTVGMTERGEETGKLFLTPDAGETVYYTSGYFVTNYPETIQELFE
jgi:hypothetical protein